MGNGDLLAQPSLMIGSGVTFKVSRNTHGRVNLCKSEEAPHSWAAVGPSTDFKSFFEITKNTKEVYLTCDYKDNFVVTLFLSTVGKELIRFYLSFF